MVDKVQSSRYEFKYIIDEAMATEVRSFVRCHLEPDKYTAGREGIGYPVHSLYFDSPDLLTCRATLQGDKNRFKLRVRFYDNNPESPLFVEIKRRQNLVILKQRAAVKRNCEKRLLSGHWLDRADLWKDSDANYQALYNFCELCQMIEARPAAYTSYVREGYEPPESNVQRVSFDRNLRAGPFTGSLDISQLKTWPRPHVPGVVLELKFTDSYPEWMHMLVESFDLRRTSMPKYVESVVLVHDE